MPPSSVDLYFLIALTGLDTAQKQLFLLLTAVICI